MARVELDIENEELRAAVRERLEHAGHSVAQTASEVVLTDDALRAMEHLKRGPTLVLANLDQVAAALAAMRAGAYGYVLVPLQPAELELQIERAALGLLPPLQGEPLALADIEARYVRAVLNRFRGNQTRAARALGIGRNTLWRKLRQYKKQG
jgi:DNA-binding NtrC family response regulator